MTRTEALKFAMAAIEDMHGSLTEDGVHDGCCESCGCESTQALGVLDAMLVEAIPTAPSYLIEGMTMDKLRDLAKRWESAHCAAGIVGSEYYADPERVFEAVRSNREALMNALRRAKAIAAMRLAEESI